MGGRIMKYDLIVIGGGPGGLMAAKTAAEDGLKVVLVERKKNIAEVDRTCGELIGRYVKATETGNGAGELQIKLEIGFGLGAKHRILLPELGISFDYKGVLRPYYNYIHFSPSGYQIGRYPFDHDEPWGFHYSKEAFLAGLLASTEKAGAEVWAGTLGLGAENTPDGVKVRVRGKSGEETLEAKAAIAADGTSSMIVESLGLNKNRRVLSPPTKFFAYHMEGVEADFGRDSFLSFAIPTINPFTSLWIGLFGKDGNYVGTTVMGEGSPKEAVDKLMKLPAFAPWFRRARVLKETAGAGLVRTPIREPVAGNVVIIGDAAAPIETTIPPAGACGYLAVKAIAKELDGQKGYPEYINWWQESFEFNHPDYFRYVSRFFSLNRLCSDEEIDYLYRVLQGKVGVPSVLISQNLELIKDKHPELYVKLKNHIDKQEVEVDKLWEEKK